MKNILLIAFLFGFGAAQAQDILITNANGDTLNGDTVVFEKYMSSQEALDTNFRLEYKKADVKNNSSQVLDVKVKRTALNNQQSGINDLLCWGGICENPTPTFQTIRTSQYSETIQPQQIIQGGGLGFAGYYQPRGNYGVTYFEYTFFDVNNQVTPASFVVEFNATQSVGIDEHKRLNSFSISPNPASEYLELNNLPRNISSNLNVEVLNIVGKIVAKEEISSKKDKERLEISHLLPGIYFVQIHSGNTYSHTQKLIVK